jgi:CARDB
VKNQGLGPAGPFRVRMAASGAPRYETFTGLAPGASEARTLDPGLGCFPWTAAVDDLAQVAESDEANNTRPLEPDTFC